MRDRIAGIIQKYADNFPVYDYDPDRISAIADEIIGLIGREPCLLCGGSTVASLEYKMPEKFVGRKVEGVLICDEKSSEPIEPQKSRFDGRKVTYRPGGYTIWPK